MRAPLFALIIACASCGGAARAPAPPMPRLDGPVAARATPDDPFRAALPDPGSPGALAAPPIVERRLKNGVRVLFVERHDVPLLSVRVVSDRGADQADAGMPQFWERSVLRACEAVKWWEVNEAWNDLGAEWSATALPDASILDVHVLSKLAEPAVELFGALVVKPVFREKSIELARQRLRAQLVIDHARADGQLELAMARHFYPAGHLYREPWAPLDVLDKIKPGHLEAYHRYAFTPAHVTIAVAGDITEAKLLPLLERAFGGLTGPTVGPQAPPPPPPATPPDPRFFVIDMPDETQGHVVFAWLGPERYHDGFVSLAIAMGDIEDALFKKLRQEKSITYGVHADAPLGRGRRLITIRSSIDTARVGEAVKDVFAVLEARAKTAPGEAEVTEMKAGAATDLVRFDRVDSTAASLGLIATYGRPTDWFATAPARIAAVTGETLRLAVERHLPLGGVRVFVAGDAKKIAPQLGALGLGTVEARGPKGL
ncbi:MAG: insulinase family protein [Deltaproteobacteria bacterium]|nr:insulinase family protein [Deltaproteobacteria bacterium]